MLKSSEYRFWKTRSEINRPSTTNRQDFPMLQNFVKTQNRQYFPCFSVIPAYILHMLRIVIRFTGGFKPGAWAIDNPDIHDLYDIIQASRSVEHKDDRLGQLQMVGMKGIDYLFSLSDIESITLPTLLEVGQ